MKNKTLPWRVYIRVVQSYRFILIYVLFHCVTPGVIYTYDDVVKNQLILNCKASNAKFANNQALDICF